MMYPVQTLHTLEKPEFIRLIAQQRQAIATLEAIVVKLIKDQSDVQNMIVDSNCEVSRGSHFN